MFHSINELLMYKCITIMEIKTSLEDERKKKISRMSDQNQFEERKPKSHLAGGI